MTSPPEPVAFYAPMKSPEHPTPSGDREIARLTLKALELAGFAPEVVSHLRTLDMVGSARTQRTTLGGAAAERARLSAAFAEAPPRLWFTYHSYYKAPDLIGPEVSRALDIPYVISEPSISPSRREGPWAKYARASEQAIAGADHLFWTTARDRPALEADGHAGKMTQLPAFLDPGALPERGLRDPSVPLRLITVAMMRPGDKVESYRRIAAALPHLDIPWNLTVVGDGTARAEVATLLNAFRQRVRFTGRIDDPARLNAQLAAADVFLWPGVGEGVGMVYLEAQAAGLPVVAEDHPSASELVAEPSVPAGDPEAFAAAIEALSEPELLRTASIRARAHIDARHSIQSAAGILRQTLRKTLGHSPDHPSGPPIQ